MALSTVSMNARGADSHLDAVGVLVIDDDQDACELMANVLRRAGYSVRTASNGREGLDALREVRPQMILLDVHMPVMDGPHFRQAQRRDPNLIAIPTVVMTADPTLDPILDMAVDQTVRKPIAVRELLAIVAGYLGPAAAAATDREDA